PFHPVKASPGGSNGKSDHRRDRRARRAPWQNQACFERRVVDTTNGMTPQKSQLTIVQLHLLDERHCLDRGGALRRFIRDLCEDPLHTRPHSSACCTTLFHMLHRCRSSTRDPSVRIRASFFNATSRNSNRETIERVGLRTQPASGMVS